MPLPAGTSDGSAAPLTTVPASTAQLAWWIFAGYVGIYYAFAGGKKETPTEAAEKK